MVHTEWSNVFEMNIVEFLNILCFTKDYNAEMKRQYDKMLKKK